MLTWYYSKKAATNTELFYEYFAPFVVATAVCLFCIVRYLAQRLVARYPRSRGGMIFLGNLTFGIYLMHPMVIWELHHKGPRLEFHQPVAGDPDRNGRGFRDMWAHHLHHQKNPCRSSNYSWLT